MNGCRTANNVSRGKSVWVHAEQTTGYIDYISDGNMNFEFWRIPNSTATKAMFSQLPVSNECSKNVRTSLKNPRQIALFQDSIGFPSILFVFQCVENSEEP